MRDALKQVVVILKGLPEIEDKMSECGSKKSLYYKFIGKVSLGGD
jgi:hypothetical protein